MVTQPKYSKEEFARRGDAVYEQTVAPNLTVEDAGNFVVIDIETFQAREHSILEIEGLGAEIWRDAHDKSLNIGAYVRELRDEWDGRD